MATTTAREPLAQAKLEELADDDARIEELSEVTDDDTDEKEQEEFNGDNVHGWLPGKLKPSLPWYFKQAPILHDELLTESSELQEAVADMCKKLINGEEQEILERNSHGIPKLLRHKHIKFLKNILGPYPAPFQIMDASRPWILYWGLAGLSCLGYDVSIYKERTIQTFTPLQNATGGFGGGHGQTSHCAASYAATLSLAIVDGLHMIDRKSMWRWLGRVKQQDGGFAMAENAEEDVRGAYCAMTIVNLLNLPLNLPPDSPANITGQETFLHRLGEWIGRCQTFEGGIGESPDNEAHGAYAFCALACLSILDAPNRSITKYLNTDRLLSWLTSRQYAPEGSFSGRTNKLVDACYSHWVGGCWSLLEAALTGPGSSSQDTVRITSLWNREALVRYTLCCSQAKTGGLRDKPGTRMDGYHTCYSLSGLSAAQNIWTHLEKESRTKAPGAEADITAAGLSAAFDWTARKATREERKAWAFDEDDTVGFVHPVFVIPPSAVSRARQQYQDRVGF